MPARDAWKDRELEILSLLAEGLPDRDIATRLQLSAQTVRWYNKQIYQRLGVASRTQAVARAGELGLLGTPALAPALPPASRSPIRYVENEGVSVAWQVIGDGPVDLLFIHGFVSHLEVAWEDPEFTAFFEKLGRVARVILFDKRGVGLSDRVQGGPSLEETIADARSVLDAAGSRRTFVLGTSEGGAAAVLLASMLPDRVRGLILFGSTAMVSTRQPEPTWSRPRERFNERVELLVSTWGEPWAVDQFAPTRAVEPAFRAWWSRLLRAASSPLAIRRVLEQAAEVDIRALLPSVPVPTLVLHRTDDRIVPLAAGRYLADRLPNATFVELPGADHVYFVRGDPVVREVARFLEAPRATAHVDTRIAILLSAAEPLMRLSPERQRMLAAGQAHHLQTLENGWLAVFDSPSQALQTARRLRETAGSRIPGMALHVGACTAREGRPSGGAGQVVSRLATAARPGQILLSGTLQDILAGTGHGVQPFHPAALDAGDGFPPSWILAD